MGFKKGPDYGEQTPEQRLGQNLRDLAKAASVTLLFAFAANEVGSQQTELCVPIKAGQLPGSEVYRAGEVFDDFGVPLQDSFEIIEDISAPALSPQTTLEGHLCGRGRGGVIGHLLDSVTPIDAVFLQDNTE